MKAKHLIIVCLLLAIITMGAASASEDIASDGLAAGNDDGVIAEPDDGVDDDVDDGENVTDDDDDIDDDDDEVDDDDDDIDDDDDEVDDDDDDEEDSPVEFIAGDEDWWDITDDADLNENAFITVSADDEYSGTVTIICDDGSQVYNRQADWDDDYNFDIFLKDLTDRNTFFNAHNFTIAFNGDVSANQIFLIVRNVEDANLIRFEEEDETELEPNVWFEYDEGRTWNVTDEDDLNDVFIEVCAGEECSGTVTITCDDDTVVFNKYVQLQYTDDGDAYFFDIRLVNITDEYKDKFFYDTEKFTVAFEGDGVPESQTFAIIRGDDGTIEIEEDDGSEEDPEDELPTFYVMAFDNFDVNNPSAAVINVRWEDDINGTLWIEMDDGREMHYFPYMIPESQKEFNMTVSDLEIDGNDGHYVFWFYYSEDEDDEPDWDDPEDMDDYRVGEEIDAEGRNYNDFWAQIHHNVNMFSSEAVITFYCGSKSEGIVNVTVYRYLDENGDERVLDGYYHKGIAESEDGYLYWDLADLELESGVGYLLFINIDDYEDSGECFVKDSVRYSEMAYLNTTDEDRIGFVFIQIPDNFVGVFKITINGTELSFNTDEFKEWTDDETQFDELFWLHPRHWGMVDKNVREYSLNILNIMNSRPYEFEGGDCDVNVTLQVHVNGTLGWNTYKSQGRVRLVSPNVHESENATITIYDSNAYYVLDEYGLIEITADDEYNVVITLDGEVVWDGYISDLGSEGVIAPVDLGGLLNKTYEMKVSVLDGDNVISELTTSVTFVYGEDGIMWSDVKDPLEYGDEGAIMVRFATDKISGNLTVMIDGEQYFTAHITGDDLEPESEDENVGWFYDIALDKFDMEIEPGVYDLMEILYTGDDGTTGYSCHEEVTVVPTEPHIVVWDVMTMPFDDVVMIYPGDDDSTFRIVILLENTLYLNATSEELGLELKSDGDGDKYYAITPEMLLYELFLGEDFGTIKVYYTSEYYSISNEEDGEFPPFNVEGMLLEVEDDYEDPVVVVYCHDDRDDEDESLPDYVVLNVRINDGEEQTFNKTFDKNTFVNWTLEELGLKEGDDAFIEVFFDNDQDPRFGGGLWVVNNTQYRVKSMDVLFVESDADAVFVFCPEGSEGNNITLSGYGFDDVKYTITKADEGNYVTFSLDDLGIGVAGYYDVDVTIFDGEWIIYEDLDGFKVIPFAEFNGNDVIVLNEDEDDKYIDTRVVSINLPYYYEGEISILIDGYEEVFLKDLDDMEPEEIDGYLQYTIFMADLDDDVSEGLHDISVNFMGICDVRTVTVAERKIEHSACGASIETFSVITEIGNPDAYFAIVYLPDESYYYYVTIGGELVDDDELNVWNRTEEDGSKTVYIAHNPYLNYWNCDVYHLTVNVNNQVMEDYCYNNATLTLIAPEIYIQYSDDEYNVTYGLNNDTMIRIGPNGDDSDFRILVKIGDEVYLDATLSELGLAKKYDDDGNLYYTLGPANFQKAIEPGAYSDVYVCYYSKHNYAADNQGFYGTDWFEVYKEKMDPDFKISIDNAEIGTPIVVTVTARAAFTGVVTVRVGDKDVSVNVVNGSGTNFDTGLTLPIGSYQANLTFEGNDEFNAGNASTTFDVTAIDPKFELIIDNVVVNNPIVVQVLADGRFTGSVMVSFYNINGEFINNEVFEVKNGTGSFTVTDINTSIIGEYKANVTTYNYENFTNGYDETTFNITDLLDPDFEIEIGNVNVGEPIEVTVTSDSGFSGDVTVNVEGYAIYVHVDVGIGVNSSTGVVLSAGDYKANMTFAGDSVFKQDYAETTFKVFAADPNFSISIASVEYGNPIVVIVTANNAFTGDVNVTVKKIGDILVSVKNGYGINETGMILAIDGYVANLIVPASGNFTSGSAGTTFDVLPWSPNFEISIGDVVVGNPIVVRVTADSRFNGIVTVKVSEYEIPVNVTSGAGVNDTTGVVLPIGDGYKANLTFQASGNYKSGYANATFNVKGIDPELAIKPISDVVEGNPVTVQLTAKDGFSAAFNVIIGNEVVATGNIVNGNGSATISADKLAVGTVTITVSTAAYGNFTAATQSAQFNVTKKAVPARIVAKDMSVMYTSGAKYSVTVYGTDGALAKNVQVVIKINGKKVATVKTNSKGVATYKTVQKPGTYKITAVALGKTLTKKLTVKHVVKLPKVKVKRSAKKLTIKVTLNKVNGKYLKKKKVTLKFKGKKYTAKTNKKGVAKFTIKSKVLKKLKKGKKVTYQATYLKDTVKRTVKVRK